ncbi:lysophospholipid acyltransferase family protein [Singulisphaera acidiphila]|uniref:Lauroyl/myristoyl acyltransferase n=3 Tax=Singulisphaera acidiphila TaxID=466153 RepID=L0DR66_SINAD|nr:Lauroyl/myristoyl acyltransferase [Singulisphaera acidiphila]AGA31467.1 Lauroyl/myristoyl acyltransferase [Singulisphaera acidiphila DSM 18658]
MTFRHLLSWKTCFYEMLLPTLRRLGPARCDALIGGLGRLSAAAWPPRGKELAKAIDRAGTALHADWNPKTVRPALAANALRFAARDYPLDSAPDEEILARFDVKGFEGLQTALEGGRGAIVVGCHLGGHIAALHWLYRRGVPLRLLVQRPRHVSRELDRRFDRDEPHPQSDFFLRRDLSPALAAERLLHARAALRDGLAVYLSGDIPWNGPNTRSGQLLGHSRTFLSVWADLAVLTRVPVFLLFCTHRPGGRYALTIETPWTLAAGEESAALTRYLARLESEIRAHPADAVAHLLWPCYGPTSENAIANSTARPSRRVAAVP